MSFYLRGKVMAQLRRVGFLALALGSAALAQEAPVAPAALAVPSIEPGLPQVPIAPPPAWVVPVNLTAPVGQGGLTIRLLDAQLRVEGDRMLVFQHNILRISNAASLRAATNFLLAWQPEKGTATVHVARIRRGTETIDLLARGGKFTTIRQESLLGAGQTNGMLTAFMPLSDVRVGDELEFAYTLDRREPNFGGKVDFEYLLFPGAKIDQAFVRVSWPQGRAVQFRAGSLVPAMRSSREGGFEVRTLTATALEVAKIDGNGPARQLDRHSLSLTDFADWNAVSTTMAPLFEQAATLSAESPIKAEIARIAAASADPQARASAALLLVQKDVRYFAELQGLGNYRPASADSVWERRIGDCKGKTVLLLALLRGLGIEAVPVLVSTGRGDGTDAILPLASRFDHVIVKATIAGQDYWLDGTLVEGAPVDRIETPDFQWALPLRLAGAGLEPIPSGPFRRPQSEWSYDLDASAGLDQPAKVSAAATIRGIAAQQYAQALDVLAPPEREEALRKFWKARHGEVTITTVASEVTPGGEFRMTMTGTIKLDWNRSGNSPTYRYEADYSRAGVNLIADRRNPPEPTAPIMVERRFDLTRQTILLPDGGAGFYIDGDQIDETIGTVHYRRTATLNGNRFETVTEVSSGHGELSGSVALAADEASDELFNRALYLHLPAAQVAAGVSTDNSATADAALFVQLQDGKYGAVRDVLTARLSANPRDAGALALRGLLGIADGRLDEAGRDLDGALAINRALPVAIDGKLRLLLAQGRLDDALLLADRAILLDPEKPEHYFRRARMRDWSGDIDGALSDYAIAAARMERAAIFAQVPRIVLLQRAGRGAEALTEARALVAAQPSNLMTLGALMDVLIAQGKEPEARALIATEIRQRASAAAYVARLGSALTQTPEQQLADMIGAIALDPNYELPLAALRTVAADPKRLARLRAAYAAARSKPGVDKRWVAVHDGRAALAGGDPAPLDQALAVLETAPANTAAQLNELCWHRATVAVGLDAARRDCEASLKLARAPGVVDSLALVEFRAGNFDLARKLYDEAIVLLPESAISLFARSLVRAKQGDSAGAAADAARARQMAPRIESVFVGFGLLP